MGGINSNPPPVQGGVNPLNSGPGGQGSQGGSGTNAGIQQLLTALTGFLNTIDQTLENDLSGTTAGQGTTPSVGTSDTNTITGQVRDTLKSSGVSATGNTIPPTDTGSPKLPIVSASASLTGGFSANPWLAPSAVAVFLKVELALAFVMTKIKLADVQDQVKLEKAKEQSVQANAQNIMSQADIEFAKAICQAVVQFASAAISVCTAVASMKSSSSAENETANEAEKLKYNPNVDKSNGDETGVSAWAEKQKDYQAKLKEYNDNPTSDNKTAMEEARQEANAIKPGFDQVNDYLKSKFGVDLSDTQPNQPTQSPTSNTIELKQETPGTPENMSQELNTSAPVNQTIELKENKLTTEDLDESSSTPNSENITLDSPSSTSSDEGPASQQNLTDLFNSEKNAYTVNSDPNSREFKEAKTQKEAATNQMLGAVNNINSSLTQAINGIIGAVFDLAKAAQQENAVYIQANIDQLTQLIESFNSDIKNTEQNESGLFSTIMNYIQAMGQISTFT